MDDGPGSSGIWQRLTRIFHAHHPDSVEQAIREASEEGELDQEEGSMLLSVLTLDDLRVQDIMTPRTDMICAAEDDSVRSVAAQIAETGHSRIPVYSGNRDNITGIVHAKDVLSHCFTVEDWDLPASRIMRESFFIPETKNVLDLLQEFRARKVHLAVILDEYGGTTGLVSIEDVLEQIVGDIEDEHDTPRDNEIERQEDGSWLVAGRAYLDDLSEALKLTLESEEVDTVGGYITHTLGRVPATGEQISLSGFTCTVEGADAKQIHSLRLREAKVE